MIEMKRVGRRLLFFQQQGPAFDSRAHLFLGGMFWGMFLLGDKHRGVCILQMSEQMDGLRKSYFFWRIFTTS